MSMYLLVLGDDALSGPLQKTKKKKTYCLNEKFMLKIFEKPKELDKFNNTYCGPLVVAIQSSLVQFPRGWEQVAFDGPSDEAHILK